MYKFQNRPKGKSFDEFRIGTTKCLLSRLKNNPQGTYMKVPSSSKSTTFPTKIDQVNLIYQYYTVPNRSALHRARQKELQYCLQRHIANKYIDRIYLLVERPYSLRELGLGKKNDKIQQITIRHRVTFTDIFQAIKILGIRGYIIFGNADIFYDHTLRNIFNSVLFYKKSAFCQTRLEWDGVRGIRTGKINYGTFNCCSGPCRCWESGAMQDAWFLHSRWCPPPTRLFNFDFGRLGCDNIFCFLMAALGFNIYNEPYTIKCYHYHRTKLRNHNYASRLTHMPYMLLPPWTGATAFKSRPRDVMYRLPLF